MLKKIQTLITLLGLLFQYLLQAQIITLAKPSEKQIRFADWEVGAFIHFGLNVFTGQEHVDDVITFMWDDHTIG